MLHSLCILHLNGGARIYGLNGSHTDTSVTTSSGHLRCEDPTGSQITRQVELPYGQRRLAQALCPASAPVSHREQDSMRRARRSRLPTLGSNYILITRHCSRPLRAQDRSLFEVVTGRACGG